MPTNMVDKQLYFATDRTLGKLAKWLRLMGFDAQCEPVGPLNDLIVSLFWQRVEPHRKLLVRSRQLMYTMASKKPLLILSNYPFEQVTQVIRFFELKLKDLKPFTRCTLCNIPLKRVEKQKVYGCIPDYVWQTQSEFRQCSGCKRIYWPGSHKDRSLIRIKKLFYNL